MTTENKKVENLKPGMNVIFTPTGAAFTIAAVNEKNISWWTGFNFKGGTGKNTLKKAWASKKKFQDGIDKGTYTFTTDGTL